MVTEKHKFVGRNIVNPVFQGVGWYRGMGIKFIDFLCQVLGKDSEPKKKGHKTCTAHYGGIHSYSPETELL
jgi:hypothetical protein